MEEQLISLETAKLAKEKRFNGKCTKVYVEEYTSYNVVKGYETHKNCLFPFCLHSISNEDTSSIEESDKVVATAPTQSLLQKWLREVHKIDVYSTWGTYLEKTVWYFYNSKISIGATFSSKKHWNTYEEALEAGLFKALNLIKNE